MAKNTPKTNRKYKRMPTDQEVKLASDLHTTEVELRAYKEKCQLLDAECVGVHKRIEIVDREKRLLEVEKNQIQETLNHLSADYTDLIKDRNELRARLDKVNLKGLTRWQVFKIFIHKLFTKQNA